MKDVTGVVREASQADLPQIVALINRAFAIERFFKSGDRTDPDQVQQMMDEGKFLLLMEGDELVACLFVKVTGDRDTWAPSRSIPHGRSRASADA